MKEILITSSILIAVVMLLRWLLRGKVSQRMIYGVWLLVALRLLIPVQFGQMDFSLLTAAKPVTQTITEISDKQVAGVTHQDSYRQVLQEYIEEDRTVFVPEIQDRIQFEITNETPKEEIAVIIDKVYSQQEVFIPEAQPQVQEKVDATADPITLGQILTGIWVVGMALMALWFICANLIFLRRARKGSTVAQFECVRVRVSPNVPTPCVVGLFRPVIYLTPACAENEQTRTHVLAHEQAHLRHGDHIWAFIRCLCLCIYWFNPLVWIAAAQSRRDCELACDESALKQLGDAERIAYGKTLLDVVSQSVTPSHLIHTATAMNESKKQLRERVNYIVKKPRNILIAAICMALVAAITAGCAFLGASPPQPAGPTIPPSQPEYPTRPMDPNPPENPTQPSDPNSPTNPGDDIIFGESPNLQIAEALVTGYTRYMSFGLCCSYEQVSEDLSAYLTESQKQNYHNWQYRITCCHTAQEVQAHIDRTLAKDLQIRSDITDRLFTDNEGNLYLIVIPMGAMVYRNVTTVEADGRLYAKSGAYDEDGWFADAYFAIENEIITDFTRTDYDGFPSWAENLSFPLHTGTIFDNPDSWYLRALTSSYTDPLDVNLARFFNLGFPDESPITDAEWMELKDIPGFQRNEKLHRLPVAKMDQVLIQVFGITHHLMDRVGMDQLAYLESTDCYYLMEQEDALSEVHFSQIPSNGNILYTNGSSAWYVYINVTEYGPRIEQNSMAYLHQVAQTTKLAREYLGMSRLEFLYTSTLTLQGWMTADCWTDADREAKYWSALSAINRSLYLDNGKLMMQAKFHNPYIAIDPPRYTVHCPYSYTANHADLKTESYQWLFKMNSHVDGANADAYGTFLMDCIFAEPEAFLQYLAEFDKDTIHNCSNLLYHDLHSKDEADQFNKLLSALLSRTDLNDQEQQALKILTQEPDWYSYSYWLETN